MSNAISDYLSQPSSTRVDSQTSTQRQLEVLLFGGLPLLGSVSDSIRTKLVSAILTDLSSASGTRRGDLLLNTRTNVRWNANTRLSALKVLKELSRLPGGSAPLGKPESLRVLLAQVDFPRHRTRGADRNGAVSPTASTFSNGSAASAYSFGSIAKTLRRAVSRRGSVQSSHSKDKDVPSSDGSAEELDVGNEPDWATTDMALRCLNNALFLNEDARLPFSSEDVGGGHVAVALLSRPEDTPADILFLGARLLFFSTLFESPFNKVAVATLNVIRIEAGCVDALVKAIGEKRADSNANASVLVSSGTEAQLNTALSDLLKAHFNICLYYPRIVEAEAKAAGGGSNGAATQQAGPILGEAFHPELLPMLRPLISLVMILPLPSPVPLTPPLTHAIAALLNYPVSNVKKEIASTKALSASTPALSAPISPSSTETLRSAPTYISRLITVADLILARYFSSANLAADDGRKVPEDVDSKAVKQKASADGIELEETLEPLLLLLRKTADEDEELRSTLRSILLPSDIDRSTALDRRTDLLGRLIRLMSSVTLPRTARAAGELLLALNDGEPKRMTETIGYGPCAGFLMNTGLASALPSSAIPTDAQGRSVDPITGEYEPTAEERARDEINNMTEEEKEKEAERLFVLFDRLNRTGVVQVRHPMEKAHEEGRFEEIEEKELERARKEEEETEREVGREMEQYRRRKEEAKSRAQKLAPHQAGPQAVSVVNGSDTEDKGASSAVVALTTSSDSTAATFAPPQP